MPDPANPPAAPGISFYTPLQSPAPGTALTSAPPPLFTPLTICSLTFQNRLWVSPMCTYSSPTGTGRLTPWHSVHLGAFALRGASLTFIEATAVHARGRISPNDAGLWEDAQIDGLKSVVEVVHSQGQKVGVQLAHAGRKASTSPPWLAGGRGKSVLVREEDGGWPNDVHAPSAIAWSDDHALPHEMTTGDINDVISDFAAAAARAVRAGVDVLEIHAAHGYLLHSFLSGVSNTRTDSYGGSFQNRIRIVLSVISAVRKVIPTSMPLFLRVSATDWLDPTQYTDAWDEAQTIRLALLLQEIGNVDLLDISSGGNHPSQTIAPHNDYQIAIAARVKSALLAQSLPEENKRMLVGAVGWISDGPTANRIVSTGQADVVFAARAFLRDAGFVLRCAQELDTNVQVAAQYLRMGRGRRDVKL